MKKNKLIYNSDDICIIGASGQFPMAGDITEFWDNIANGRDCITRHPEKNTDGYISAYGVLKDSYKFDNKLFGIGNFDAAKMDIQQRKLFENVYAALENAGYSDRKNDNHVTGLYASVRITQYVWEDCYIYGAYDKEKSSMIGMYTGSSIATRLAYILGFTGPCLTFDGACASSLAGIHLAVRSLQCGDCDHCIVAAASIGTSQDGYYTVDGTISNDGYTRAYDRNGTGFVPGSAAAAIVLKRYGDAVRDNDNILGVIKGTFLGNDGTRKLGYAAPGIKGEYEAVQGALKRAGISPDDVRYTEGHGTGTPLGDSVEISALKKVFVNGGHCALGSVKSNIGHTDSVAGLAGLIKVLGSFYMGIIPKTIHCSSENEEINDNSPVFIAKGNIQWKHDEAWIAAVSAFGIGGVNSCIIVQEPPYRPYAPTENVRICLPISADTEDALRERVERFQRLYRLTNDHTRLASAVEMLSKKSNDCFRTVINEKVLNGKEEYLIRRSLPQKNLKTVFVFPGGGSQFGCMGRDLYGKNPVFRRYMNNCLIILEEKENISLKPYLNGDEELSDTAKGLCMIFCMSFCLAMLLVDSGIKPDLLLGSSLGEYVASCISGVFSLEETLHIIAARGRLIEKTESGAMISVSANQETVLSVIEGTDAEISAVNYLNRVLVSGTEEVIEQVCREFDRRNIVTSHMNVQTAGHCRLVDPIAEDFYQLMSNINFGNMDIPLISSYKGGAVSEDEVKTADFWCEHLRHTADFYSAAKSLLNEENIIFIEVGTGMQLSTFIRKIFIGHNSSAVITLLPYKEISESEQLLYAALELWSYGKSSELSVINGSEFAEEGVFLPTRCFEGEEFRHSGNKIQMVRAFSDNSAEVKKDQTDEKSSSDIGGLDNKKQQIINIIKGILSIDNVSETDRLIDIGFDSLSMLIIGSRINEEFALKIGLDALNGCMTVKDLIEAVLREEEHMANADVPSIVWHERSNKDIFDLINELL